MDLRMGAAEEAGTGLRLIDSPKSSEKNRKLAEAAHEFEAYILKMLLQEMRKSVESGGLFEDKSMEGYSALMDDALARRAAEAGTFGLAEQLLRHLESK
ncbi:MAG: hypothetical protein E2O73_01615 [Deltaproteobacteria bacterium]|nr:MAG: hypothetical protein E2O73_01615 [Deltaproteobacteria bacterium]